MAGTLGRTGCVLAALAVLFLLITSGCGSDDDSVLFDCPDCGHWTKIADGHVNFPSYMPGSDRETIAFSSDRGNNGNIENIWVAGRDGDKANVFYQITDTPTDDFDPAWSSTGDRLVFTRAAGSGYELYLINVEDFSNPGDPIRLTFTDVSDTVTIDRPSSPTWLDDNTILFSDGKSIYSVVLDGDIPTTVDKVIDDPSDYIFSGTDDFVENQPVGIRSGMESERIVFVSDSRVPLGAIEVTAEDRIDASTIAAEIHLEGVATSTLTPSVVGGRPLGGYLVGAQVTDEEAEETYCDTMLTSLITVFENDTTDVHFQFDNPRGAFRLLASPFGANFYVDGLQRQSIHADTSWIDCVYPGVLHLVQIVSIEARDSLGVLLRDSAWVSVAELETATVVLNVTGQTGKRTVHSDAPGSSHTRLVSGKNLIAESTQQERIGVLWLYDGDTGSYFQVSEESEYASFPALDPTGEYLAYIVDFNTIKIASAAGEWWIPLPGATGINICFREVAYPTWSADGSHLILSLSPCIDKPSSDHNAAEFECWEVDVSSFID